MRIALAASLSALALAIPTADAFAATQHVTTAKKKITVATKSFTGTAGSAQRWGDVQVTIVVRKTTTVVGTKKTVKRRIVSVKVPTYPNHTDRSMFINSQALPLLVQETLKSQSASIDLIGGATDTSYGFQSSLQSAILKARAW
jgi:uncharacterized protein with FMN-binding domain